MSSTGQGLPCGVPEYASVCIICFVCFLTEYIWIARAPCLGYTPKAPDAKAHVQVHCESGRHPWAGLPLSAALQTLSGASRWWPHTYPSHVPLVYGLGLFTPRVTTRRSQSGHATPIVTPGQLPIHQAAAPAALAPQRRSSCTQWRLLSLQISCPGCCVSHACECSPSTGETCPSQRP